MRRQLGLPHDSLLRDHALSYMLAGIAGTAALQAACAEAGNLAEEIEAPYTFVPRYERQREDSASSLTSDFMSQSKSA